MTATLVVRHKVEDYAAWRNVYDELEPLRARHGCTAKGVMQLPARSFAHDPALQAGMARAGVDGPPRIEIFAIV